MRVLVRLTAGLPRAGAISSDSISSDAISSDAVRRDDAGAADGGANGAANGGADDARHVRHGHGSGYATRWGAARWDAPVSAFVKNPSRGHRTRNRKASPVDRLWTVCGGIG